MDPVVNPLYFKFEGVFELLQVYREADSQIDRFQQKNGMKCRQFCSHCCHTPNQNIEASVFEMVPMAIHLWENHEMDEYLDKLLHSDHQGPCVVLSHNKMFNQTGYCSKHEFRPLVCRMFGFSARIEKTGQESLHTCSFLKKDYAHVIEQYPALINNEEGLPVLAHLASQTTSLNPMTATKRLPINVALAEAIAYVGMRLDYEMFDQTEAADGNSDDNGQSPTIPAMPSQKTA